MAFKEFDKEFRRDALAEDLRKEIERDRIASIEKWFKAQQAAKAKAAIEARVAALEIEVRDARKAAKVLGLPSSAVSKLQAALDGPALALPTELDAIARACKLKDAPSGTEMVKLLRKERVL
jgi:hypothetical protein